MGTLDNVKIEFQSEEQKKEFDAWAYKEFGSSTIGNGSYSNEAYVKETPADVEKLGDGVRLFGGKLSSNK
jgi:hypothetical protein